MRKISVGLFALAASLALGATTVAAKDYGDSGGGGGGGGGQSHQSAGGGGGGEKMHGDSGGGERMHHDSGGDGERMHHDSGGGGERMRHDDGGGVEKMRHRDDDGGREHHRHGHWRGGIWIYDDYDEGYGGGYCYRWRHECADRWGWGGPGFYRCLRRHGC